MSIDETRREFEASFVEAQFYNKQTQDSDHLEKILSAIQIKMIGRYWILVAEAAI